MALFFKKKKNTTVYQQLSKTEKSLGSKIRGLFSKNRFDATFFEELEETLIMADVSVETTLELMKKLEVLLKQKENKNQSPLALFESLILSFIPDNNFDINPETLNIIFVFGVNGVGKTTSIAKLASLFLSQELSVLVAAADTYRAAATEQLVEWCKKVKVPLVKHEGKSKPSAVIYDAIEASLARKVQVLIVDTAGRLHNKENLMEELKKLNKILADKAPQAKKYNLLVVDANTGQNAIMQTKNFNESVGINGVLMSKMDSTAKGGIALTLAHELSIPVVFMGLGEKVEDLCYFEPTSFVKSIF